MLVSAVEPEYTFPVPSKHTTSLDCLFVSESVVDLLEDGNVAEGMDNKTIEETEEHAPMSLLYRLPKYPNAKGETV